MFREEFWAAAPPVQNMEWVFRFANNIYIFVINLILLYTIKNKKYCRKRVWICFRGRRERAKKSSYALASEGGGGR